jgi:hypothetical protein
MVKSTALNIRYEDKGTIFSFLSGFMCRVA